MLEINNTTKQKINLKKIRKITERFLGTYKKPGRQVSLAIIGPARMKKLNYEYRGINQATDVLSFPGQTGLSFFDAEPDRSSRASKYLGEIIINIDETGRTRKYRALFREIGLDFGGRAGNRQEEEYLVYFLLVHGLLHLIGYDDATEAGRREMVRLGRKFLEKNGVIMV